MPLFSYLEKEQIPATRCTKCKMTHFPPRADCPNCRGDSVEWITLGGSCRLVTFTQVHFAPPAFQPDAPYSLGVAELSNGLRVFAPIGEDLSGTQLRVGMELVLRTRGSGCTYRVALGQESTVNIDGYLSSQFRFFGLEKLCSHAWSGETQIFIV